MRTALPSLLLLALAAPVGAQVTWRTVVPSAPFRLSRSPLVHDTKRDVFLLFGVYVVPSTVPLHAQTWELRGTTWTRRTPMTVPTITDWPLSMAYDARRDRVVLFGGPTAETWEWDGTDWLQRRPVRSPPASPAQTMYYDSVRDRCVLVASWGHGVEVWTWDGSSWQGGVLAGGPPSRNGFAIAVDPVSGVALLFGGQPGSYTPLADTWLLVNGATWHQLSGPAPTARLGHAICFDPLRRRFVLYGGWSPTLGDTWEWDGGWQLRASQAAVSPRHSHSMLWDAIRERVLLFGGAWGTGDVSFPMTDVAEYGPDSPASFTRFGNGCSGPNVAPDIAPGLRPWIGGSVWFSIVGLGAPTPIALLTGASDKLWNQLQLPLDLRPAGMPGCSLYCSIDLLAAMSGSPQGTPVTYPVPNDPRLVGARYFHQALALDARANAAGVVSSAAAALRIGQR